MTSQHIAASTQEALSDDSPSRAAAQAEFFCIVCGQDSTPEREEAQVNCNVRAFSHESFWVWRCRSCGSLHARDPVDLAHYYAGYPFFDLPDDWRVRAIYAQQLRRLERAGLKRGQSLLDYGCGSGAFVRHARREGYADAVGFDEYSELFRDPAALERTYDCVLSQDVIEHVSDPHAHVDRLVGLTNPGGIVAIGTPNAEALDLSRVDEYRHALHLPYHRHILSKRAVLSSCARRGLHLRLYFPTQYANTRIPFLNSPFYRFFMKKMDDSLDCLFDPPRLAPIFAELPRALCLGLAGSYFAEETDVMFLFEKPVAEASVQSGRLGACESDGGRVA